MTPHKPDRPNVLVFMTDQQRWDSLGVHGNPLDLTPNLDCLAGSGTDMTHAFTPQPVCAPARSVLQTGQYATQTGVFRNSLALKPESRTLAHHFNDAGYDTAYIGKWHLADSGVEPVPPELRGGYQHWLAADIVEFISDAYDARLFNSDGEQVRMPGYRSDAHIDAAIRYIADRTRPRADRDPSDLAPYLVTPDAAAPSYVTGSATAPPVKDPGGDSAASSDGDAAADGEPARPFFLFLSLIEPHHQNNRDDYPAPLGYEERYRDRWAPRDLVALGGSSDEHLGGYWGMVRRVDEGFGRLMDALESMGLRDNTVVAFTTDHGCHFKTRNGEYKRSAHDASIRVPLVLDGPGFRGGGDRDDLVSLIDLPPTLLDAAGIDIPEQMQGRSLLACGGGPGKAANRPAVGDDVDPEDVFIQISESQVGRAIRTRRWKYAVKAYDADGWHDPAADEYTEDLLYDLASDPYELDNLVGRVEHAEVAAALRERLLTRIVEAGESRPVIHPAGSRDAVEPAARS